MELKEFIDLFASQFEDTPADQISAQTVFKDLDEWSSFMALALMAAVGEACDVNLTATQIRTSETVEDLFNCIVASK